MKYFRGINTLQELKTAYRQLVLKNHPDVGGDMEIMKAINNEYEKALQLIKDNPDNPDSKKAFYDVPQEFFNIVAALIHLDGLEIEICGTWLWITGNTRRHAAYLKAHGCKWAAKKQAWYWHCGDYRKYKKSEYTLNEIRYLFGSEKIERDEQMRIA